MTRIFTTVFFVLVVLFSKAQNVGLGTSSPVNPLSIEYEASQSANGTALSIMRKGGDAKLEIGAGLFETFIRTSNARPLRLGINGVPHLTIDGNGSVGINTTGPLASFHVYGTTRLQGDVTITGMLYTATWAFRVCGLPGGTNQIIPENVWTKVNFGNGGNTNLLHGNYNLENAYQPNQSEVYITAKGIYSFKAQVTYDFGYRNEGFSGIRLMLRSSNGTVTTIMESSKGAPVELAGGVKTINNIIQTLSTEIWLQAGDSVWIETHVDNPFEGFAAKTSAPVFANSLHTFFCGSLVSRF